MILLLAAAPPAAALLAADSPASLFALQARPTDRAGRDTAEKNAPGQDAPGRPEPRTGGAPSATPAASGAESATMAGWGSSTMAGMAVDLAALAATHRMSYVDGGVGGQTAEQILARLGSRPARMEAGRVPPRGAVVLTTASMSARSPAAFDAWGMLAGIPGRLAKDRGRQRGYTFVRTLPGPALGFPDGTPFIPATPPAIRTGINHLNIGKNNLTARRRGVNDPARIAAWTGEAHDWLAAAGARVLVWGHFANTGTGRSSTVRRRILQVNDDLQARYGRHYLDLYGLLTGGDVWDLAGVRPTTEDLREQRSGNKPPGLSADRAHLNGAGRHAVRLAVEHHLAGLGWFTTAAPAPRLPAPFMPAPRPWAVPG